MFDRDQNGSITKQELKSTVISVFKDRKSVSSSLRDMGSAVGKLDVILTVLTVIISLIAGLLVFGISLSSFLLSGVSLILAITYAFCLLSTFQEFIQTFSGS